MKEIKEDKEEFDVKYIKELDEYFTAYMSALINEIFVGVGINLGLSEKKAYSLAKNDPEKLEKAKFFSSIFDKFKGIFNYKVPKFRYKKKIYGDGKPMTPVQWDTFNNSIDSFWKDRANAVAEDLAVKSHELGKQTTEYRKTKKPYKNKSLQQVDFEQYDGKMPSTFSDAYKKYDFGNKEKQNLNKEFSSVAMYVTKTNDDIKEAIRQNIQIGMDENKSPQSIASDLYWNIEKNENLNNKYTAESLRRNWSRVASTELATIYNNATLQEFEDDAMKSLKASSKSVYFVRTGGNCKWCLSVRGTIVRLVPNEIVTDTKNESLRSMGIKDPHTDIAIWIGKNNVGLKEKDWMISVPGHPNNVATFSPIDLGKEEYNPKTDDVEKKQEKDKYIPQQIDYAERSKEEKDARKPTFVGANLVRMNNSVYEAVDSEDYKKKKAKWDKDPSLPIPVNKNSTDFKQIFDEAEKNR